MATIQPAHYSGCGCHTAQGDRQVLSSLVCAEGVALDLGGGLLVTQRAAGANMSVDIASGNAFIQGDFAGAWTGMYHVSNDGAVNVVVDGADPSLARTDRVVAVIRDSTYSGSSCDWYFDVLPGTPGGGAPATPSNAISLATILIPAADTAITNSQITDTRTAYESCPSSASPQVPVAVVATHGQVIDFATTYPWAKRAVVKIRAGAGAGGGAAATAAGQCSGGGGGGGGGYGVYEFYPPLLAGPVTCTVGAGGVAVAGGTGGAGGDSVITDGTTTITAAGGGGASVSGPSAPPLRTGGPGTGGGVTITGTLAAFGLRENYSGDTGFFGSILTTGNGYSGQGGRSAIGRGGSPVGATGNGLTGGSSGGGSGGLNFQSQGTDKAGGNGSNGDIAFFLYSY